MKLTDLKFANIEKEHLAANYIDTVFLISENEVLNLGESDTFGYRTYDKKGNLLIEVIRKFWGHYLEYKYDSIDFVKYKDYNTDFSAKFNSTYMFLADSLLLYQFWTGNDTDTCIFKFDKSGKVIESTEYANDDHGRGWLYKKIYGYNASGQLIKKTVSLLINQEYQERFELEYGKSVATRNITDYFYAEKKLDSTVTAFYFPSHLNQNYKSISYYNNRGLKDRTVEMDSIMTHYSYKTRKN
ncbi:MAG: hypothetical protein ACHQNT_07125 [Bacteroidia bacterium]